LLGDDEPDVLTACGVDSPSVLTDRLSPGRGDTFRSPVLSSRFRSRQSSGRSGTGRGGGRRNARLSDQSAAVQMTGARGEKEHGRKRPHVWTGRSRTVGL